VIITFSELKELISEAKSSAKDKANKQYSVVRSRGDECSFDVAFDDPINKPFSSKKELTKSFEYVMNNHDVIDVHVQGGFDAADSLHDLNNGLYDPLVEEWSLKIWDKENGHYTYEMIYSQLDAEE
jgi:hypothetical protein